MFSFLKLYYKLAHYLLNLLAVASIIFVGIITYIFSAEQIPLFLHEKIISVLHDHGYNIKCTSIKINPVNGITFNNIFWSSHQENNAIFLQAEKIHINTSIISLFNSNRKINSVNIDQGVISFLPQNDTPLTIRDISLQFAFSPSEIQLLQSKLSFPAFTTTIAGTFSNFKFPSSTSKDIISSEKIVTNQLNLLLTKLNYLNNEIKNFDKENSLITKHATNIFFPTKKHDKANVNISFNVPINKPADFSCQGDIFIPKRSAFAIDWDNFLVSFSANANSVTIPKMTIYLPSNQNIEMSANYNINSKKFSLISNANISTATILKPLNTFFPELKNSINFISPQNHPLNLKIALPEQAFSSTPTISATISGNYINLFENLQVSNFQGMVNFSNRNLEFKLTDGSFNNKTSASCHGRYIFDSDELFINGLVNGDPSFADNFILNNDGKNNFQKICAMFTWQENSPPITNFALHTFGSNFQFVGDIQATNFAIYNNLVQSLTTQIAMHYKSNDEMYLTIDNLHLVNDKKQSVTAKGSYHFPENRPYGYINFDGEATLPPQLLIAYFGNELSFLKDINFGNILHYKGKGYIDLDKPELNNFSFDTNIDSLKFQNYAFNNVSGNIAMQNNCVAITNFNGNNNEINLTGDVNYHISDEIVNYDGILKTKDNLSAQSKGSLTFTHDYDPNTLLFSINSSLSPKIITEFLKLNNQLFDNFYFGKKTSYSAQGLINFIQPELNNFTGLAKIDSLKYKNHSIANLSTNISMQNNQLAFTNYSSDYDDAKITGDISYNLMQKIIQYNLLLNNNDNRSIKSNGTIALTNQNEIKSLQVTADSSISPQKVASYLNLDNQLLKDYNFGDNLTYDLQGFIHFQQTHLSEFSSNIKFQSFQYKKFLAQNLSCSINMKNNSISINNFKSEFANGKLQGTATYNLPTNSAKLDLSVRDASMHLLPVSDNPPHAIINAHTSAELTFQDNSSIPLINGSGEIVLTDGDFWQVPILSSLNSYLQKIIPIKNFGKISNISSDLEFKDNTIHLAKINTDGDVIAFKGNGEVFLDKKTVDITLEIKPLKNLLWNSVGFLLSPITKNILINLKGPYDDLKWSPATSWNK